MTQSSNPGAGVPFNKVKKDVVYDLMRGGAGTPWENRGEHGAVGGFVKSACRAIFNPGMLFDHIRTTTVTADAQTFLWICAACWGVGTALVRLIAYFLIDPTKFTVDPTLYLATSAIATAVAVGWSYAMSRLIMLLYHKLATTEVKQPVPATLTFNVGAYAMGPSFFAVVPVIGPLAALVGCFVALVAAGRKRLFISWRGAVIDALLPFVVAIVATLALYFVLTLIQSLTGMNPVEPIPVHVDPSPM